MLKKMKQWIRKWLGIDETDAYANILSERTFQLDKKFSDKTAGLDFGEEVRQNSTLEYILGSLAAIEKKLGGKAVWHWEDDPSYPLEDFKIKALQNVYGDTALSSIQKTQPQQKPQIRVWTLEKNKKKTKLKVVEADRPE